MFGIGTYIKSVCYDALVAAMPGEDWAYLRRLAPDYFEYRRQRLMAILSREWRYLYMVNPKAACTSVRNRLREMNGYPPLDDPRLVMGHKDSGFVIPCYLTLAEWRHVLTSPDYFRFSFVRNPFERLVSSYVYFQRDSGHTAASGPGFRLLAATDPRRDAKFHSPLSFEAFVRSVCEDTHYPQDQHWRPQVEILRTDLISYTFIGRVENFAADMEAVMKRLSVPADVVARAGAVTNASERREPAAAWYAPALVNLVRRKFTEDFRQFDYSHDPPE